MGTLEIISILVGGLCALVLLFQDLRSRSIHIIPTILLGISGVAYSLESGMLNAGINILQNLIFIGLILGTVWLYFRIREGGKFWDEKIGWGDGLFLLMSITWISGLSYLLFFVSGLILLLLGIAILAVARSSASNLSIPLAGLLSPWLMVFVWLDRTGFSDQIIALVL